MLRGKKILLAITGSIAAYKSAVLVRLLVKHGAEVKVVMTKNATGFITPLTISTLAKNPVLIELSENNSWTDHVMLGRWADVMLIAPASCNTISKMAHGQCDNLLLAVYLSATCPVMVAPAMDEDMWHFPETNRNIHRINRNGNIVLQVNNGELASGLTGEGRMAEPEEILEHLETFFTTRGQLAGLKALVTAGPTYEAIDPVRFIGNHSSGKMGVALAEELASRGADVQLVLGPSAIEPSSKVKVEKVVTADEMYAAAFQDFEQFDIIIMAAAVADFKPKNTAAQKIKKLQNGLTLELVKTKDLLAKAGEIKSPNQTLVGFALETENEKQNALEKLSKKKADLLILNSLNDPGAGFAIDTNKISIFDKHGNEFHFDVKTKKAVAADIINTIVTYRNA